TSAGVFARLAADVALGGLAPAGLLGLLKHPLLRLDAHTGGHTRAVAALEKAVLRGPRPRPGSAGLAHALSGFHAQLLQLRRRNVWHFPPAAPRTPLREPPLARPAGLVGGLTGAPAPLEGLRPATFAAIAARHRDVIAVLGTDDDGACPALVGLDGQALDAV